MIEEPVLGIDFGTKRIGVAIASALGPRPLEVIRRTEIEVDLERIAEIVREERVRRVVVGVPFSLDGSVGPAAARAKAFITLLEDRLGFAVEIRDEALTSYEADLRLDARGVRDPAERRRWRDAYAAMVILEDALAAS